MRIEHRLAELPFNIPVEIEAEVAFD